MQAIINTTTSCKIILIQDKVLCLMLHTHRARVLTLQ